MSYRMRLLQTKISKMNCFERTQLKNYDFWKHFRLYFFNYNYIFPSPSEIRPKIECKYVRVHSPRKRVVPLRISLHLIFFFFIAPWNIDGISETKKQYEIFHFVFVAFPSFFTPSSSSSSSSASFASFASSFSLWWLFFAQQIKMFTQKQN